MLKSLSMPQGFLGKLAKASSLLLLVLAISAYKSPSKPERSRELDKNNYPSQSQFLANLSDELKKDCIDYYKCIFTTDGYMSQITKDGDVYEHPIYGAYSIQDYIDQIKKDPDRTKELRPFLTASVDAAIKRMRMKGDGLIFYYDKPIARDIEKHYSALTQGYYANSIYQAGTLLNRDDYKVAAKSIFNSLQIPASDGGVLFDDGHGISIAEVAQSPNSLILNGWLSALVSIYNYYELSGDEQALSLFRKSMESMIELLPRYDANDLRLSRYGLTGFTQLELKTKMPSELVSINIIVEGEKPVKVARSKGNLSNWNSFIYTHAARIIRANLVLSHAAPTHLLVKYKNPVDLNLRIYLGEYSKLSAAPVNKKWAELGEFSGNEIIIPIDEAVTGLVAYPTNFLKILDGKQTNVYHTIHIERLDELSRHFQDERLDYWIKKWKGYVCENNIDELNFRFRRKDLLCTSQSSYRKVQ